MPESSDLKRIGRYNIERVLGEGAMGVVYEGNDTRLHRKVAIKTILKSALDSESAKEYSMRFAREAQAVARLNHPNIVQVFDFAEEGDVAYIVMEMVRGRELRPSSTRRSASTSRRWCTSWASCASRFLRGLRGRRRRYNDDVRVETEAIRDKSGKPLAATVRGPVVDQNGLPIHITQLAQALEEGAESVRPQRVRTKREETEPRNLLDLLRFDGKR